MLPVSLPPAPSVVYTEGRPDVQLLARSDDHASHMLIDAKPACVLCEASLLIEDAS